MTKIKNTKRALLLSALSLLMCVSMLIGSTFAWFTDSVTSGSNVIKSGNLDVDVVYTLDGENWADLQGADNLFQKGLWEPGHTEVVVLKIANKGSLALKYAASMNIIDETIGKTKDGKDIVLSDILTVSTLTQQTGAVGDIAVALAFAGEDRVAYETTAPFKAASVLGANKELLPGDAHYVVIKVDMDETVGNEANHDGKNVPSIEFGINVLATQFTHEEDSFGNQYDVNAWTEVAETPAPDANGVVDVYSAQQLAGVMANTAGIKVINIKEDIDLNGRSWAPAYVSAPDLVINGNGHTISNMTTNGKDYQGFIGVAYQNLTINDLTFEKATVNANTSFTGGIIGWAWGNADITFNNVDVIDSEVSTTLGNKAIRVGALIGFFPYDGGNLTLKDCDVVGSTVTGYHNVGAMVGTTLTQKTVTIENCTAKNNTLKYGSPNVGAFAFGASTSGYTEYVPASGFTAENNTFKKVAEVANTTELQAAINSGATEIALGAGEFTADLYVVPANRELTITGQGAATKLNFKNQQVRLELFDSLTISNCTIGRMVDKSWGQLVFGSSTVAGGVYTISNCIFNGEGTQGIYINQNVAATFNIENCTFNGDFGGEGAITIQDNDVADLTVNVTGCSFNNIPATSHEIAVLQTSTNAWTLNAEGVTVWKRGY